VNCAPLSVLNISGRPWFNAYSAAAAQKPAAMVLEGFQTSTCRLCQSMMPLHATEDAFDVFADPHPMPCMARVIGELNGDMTKPDQQYHCPLVCVITL